MDNNELLAQIQQMMVGLETRMTEKVDSLETRMTEKVDNLEIRMTAKIEESEKRVKGELITYVDQSNEKLKKDIIAYIGQNNAEIKDYIDQNNVVIGEMMTKALEQTTAKTNARIDNLQEIVQKNLFDIEILKNDVSKLKQKGA